MLRVRPASLGDLSQIEGLLQAQTRPVSTLPADRSVLVQRLEWSAQSFHWESRVRGQERFLFVLEDTGAGRVLGIAGIDASAGSGAPFYSYRRDSLFHSSPELGIHNEVPVLYLTHELSGSTHLCAFCLDPEHQNVRSHALLSSARLLYLAAHAEIFHHRVIIELPGVQDEAGNWPFWDSLGRHFFGLDFEEADTWSGMKSRTFLAEMMPVHPIYVALLTRAARDALGKAHQAFGSNVRFLENQGFKAAQHLDIFHGGPTLECGLDAIRIAREVRPAKLRIRRQGNFPGEPAGHLQAAEAGQLFVCNPSAEGFCVAVTESSELSGAPGQEQLRVSAALAEGLQVAENETILMAGVQAWNEPGARPRAEE